VRFVVDPTWRRFGGVVVAGSPTRLFRLTSAGAEIAEAIERGADVAPSVLTDRWLDTGAIHPDPQHLPRGPFGLDDVTVVTPQLGGERAPVGRIVVDDGSTPPIAGATLRLPSNRGPAAARNAGAALVDSPVIAFVDADVEIPDDPLPHLAPLLDHFDDPRVALVAPRIGGEERSPLDMGPTPARVSAGSRVSYVPGAVVLVRRAAFEAIGGFDDTMRFGEDVDLVWRLEQAGWRCRYDPCVVVDHRPRPDVVARLRQHADYGSSAAPLALRHPGRLAPFRSNGWTAAMWVLALLGRPLAGAAIGIGSAAALVPKLPDVPPRVAFELALRGHVASGGQLAAAVRRAWWPLVATAALGSRRARRWGLLALALGGRSTLTDLAYGWGVWRGVLRHRTADPLLPVLSRWPPR
jgi:mycofactocin system glycosyltransferase